MCGSREDEVGGFIGLKAWFKCDGIGIAGRRAPQGLFNRIAGIHSRAEPAICYLALNRANNPLCTQILNFPHAGKIGLAKIEILTYVKTNI